MEARYFLLGFSLILFLDVVLTFPTGAPKQSCTTMYPDHEKDPQASPSPYRLMLDPVDRETVTPGEEITVTIYSPVGQRFKGFILQARHPTTGDNTTIAGDFGVINDKHTKVICDSHALSHKSWRYKNKVKGKWTVPAHLNGEFVFIASIVEEYSTFWMNVRSAVLRVHRPDPVELPYQNQTLFCNESVLEPLPVPVDLPHVAILCGSNEHCPCSQVCCNSGSNQSPVALCRKPKDGKRRAKSRDFESRDNERHRARDPRPRDNEQRSRGVRDP